MSTGNQHLFSYPSRRSDPITIKQRAKIRIGEGSGGIIFERELRLIPFAGSSLFPFFSVTQHPKFTSMPKLDIKEKTVSVTGTPSLPRTLVLKSTV